MSCSSWGPNGSGQSLVVIAGNTFIVSLPGDGSKNLIPFTSGVISVYKGTDLSPLLSSSGILVNTTGVYEIRAGYSLAPGTALATAIGFVWVNTVSNKLLQHQHVVFMSSNVGYTIQANPDPPFYAQLTAGNIVGLGATQNTGGTPGGVAECSLSIFGPLIAP